MKKPEVELEWTLITLTAAALVAALLVSCAPTHRSYPLTNLQAPSNPVAPPADNNGNSPDPQASTSRAPGADSAIAGNWLCENSSDCVVSSISLLPDGAAVADGQKAQLSIAKKGQNLIHVTLSVPAHDGVAAATLEGDVSTNGEVDELPLGGALYARAAD